MSKAWIRGKLPEFVRDVFRNFCQASMVLEEQFKHYNDKDRISFKTLRDLIGVESSKGLLWRLKDSAHHVFRNDPEAPLEGRFLDWGMGYIFHEAVKLKEDAYQRRNYAPWFRELQDSSLPQEHRDISGQLFLVLRQTEESIQREIDRIRFIMSKCRQLLPIYLSRHKNNALLARLIVYQNDLVREVFGAEYDGLVAAIYGQQPEIMYVLASQSLRMGGWVDEAEAAMAKAQELNPQNRMVLQEKKIIDNWLQRIKG